MIKYMKSNWPLLLGVTIGTWIATVHSLNHGYYVGQRDALRGIWGMNSDERDAITGKDGDAFSRGYEFGQAQALSDQWIYQRVETADGNVNYVKLLKPVKRKDFK